MKVSRTSLPGVLLLEPAVFKDERGYLFEQYQARRYAELGVSDAFVQDNVSFSEYGVLRGLHLQHPHDQGKLVTVLLGEVWDVAVDVRVGSPTYGQWAAATLSQDNCHQFFIPEGFAHGFCVMSERALVLYKCTDVYVPAAAMTIAWDDPELGIRWPIREPKLSPTDGAAPRLSEIDRARLPLLVGVA
jgi:dTDP-4-dehydrorhamnose 3,5-epimerase